MKLFDQKTLESLRAQGKAVEFISNPREGILLTILGKDGEEWYGQTLSGGDDFLEQMERAFEEALRKSNIES